jgi:hypothetical protein
VFREQVDWTFILPLAASCENTRPLAEKNGAMWSEQIAQIVHFFHLLNQM